MMTRHNDILFMSEYVKNVLYFAITRPEKVLKNTSDTYFFNIDNELVYENYMSDFGPLNLGCIFKYCKILNEKLGKCLNNEIIVHYTSSDPKKSTNAAFLMGCFGVLYLSLPPKEALIPLIFQGYNFRPFQDATMGESSYTISLLDCLQALDKARELGFYNFNDFDYEEYNRLDKIEGGDLNWIVPGKFLAFIGPVESRGPIYHRPEEYIDYFKDNNVKIVIRLNKKMYDGNVFNNVGIIHYDLFFLDGSCPPKNILLKFLRISECSDGAIAVHCKAGLGRTGSLIGCYLMKHYRMTSHEAIGWMRICRPGSVIGQQQEWLEQLEPLLIKHGNLYRKRLYGDFDKLPTHDYGLYSITHKALKHRPFLFNKSPSPPPPMQRQNVIDRSSQSRPQASKVRKGTTVEIHESETEETFVASCDLSVPTNEQMYHVNGFIINNNTVLENCDERQPEIVNVPKRRKLRSCFSCPNVCGDFLWKLTVRCAKLTPKFCDGTNKCCSLLDKVRKKYVQPHKHYLSYFHKYNVVNFVTVSNVSADKEQYTWSVKSQNTNIARRNSTENQSERRSRRASGSGEPRTNRWSSREYSVTPENKKNPAKYQDYKKKFSGYAPIPTFCTTQGPIVKTINEAKDFLMRSSMYKEHYDRQLNSSLTLSKPSEYSKFGNTSRNITACFTTPVARDISQASYRRRLGRSPSPPPIHKVAETRATNTLPPSERMVKRRDSSKTAIRDALSRLKLNTTRYGSNGAGSVGAASLGARRLAPSAKRAPSVRSDERPTATQGDVLNSIKYQRRLRESLLSEKANTTSQGSSLSKAKMTFKKEPSDIGLETRRSQKFPPKDRSVCSSSRTSPTRPASPKPRRNFATLPSE